MRSSPEGASVVRKVVDDLRDQHALFQNSAERQVVSLERPIGYWNRTPYAMMSWMTFPPTSVSRKSRPLYL